MDKYNGIVFTGGAMRINDMTDVIKKHIKFASDCFEYKNKIIIEIVFVDLFILNLNYAVFSPRAIINTRMIFIIY